MTTSGTYQFQNVAVELLIREAFERIGIAGEMMEYQKLDAAMRSLNFMLAEWMTRGVNLWTLETAFLPLIEGQSQFTLTSQVKNITQASLRMSYRKLGGAAASVPDGNAQNAFDGDWQTACTQTQANGTISYDYGVGQVQRITFVGIQTNVPASYTLTLKGTDGNGTTFTLLTLSKQAYEINAQGQGLTRWFEVPNPGLYQTYSITETGGATLNVQEIYFNNTVQDTILSEVSRSEYLSTPLKSQTGRPTCYYLDRQIIPQLYLWPAPSSLYTCLVFSYEKVFQDVGNITHTLELPSRFYEPVIWGLAYRMACKYAPDKMDFARQSEQDALRIATSDDTEKTPISIYGTTER